MLKQGPCNTVLHPCGTVETHNNFSPVGNGLTHLGVSFMAGSH